MLVGRAREMARVAELLDGARQGRSGALVLRGDPGVGKSALLGWAREQAAGFLVLSARGTQSEVELAYAGLADLFRPVLDRLDVLPPRQTAALASALAIADAPAGERFAVASATLAMVDDLAAQTGGNPLALLELIPLLTGEQLGGVEPLPDPLPAGASAERPFGRRVAALDPPDRQALLVAAAGATDDIDAIWRAAGTLGLVPAGFERAEAAGLLTVDAAGMTFRHPLVRAAVYGSAAPSQRRAVHRALADALPGALTADRRAWHLAAAALGPDEDAASQLEAAADLIGAADPGSLDVEYVILTALALMWAGELRRAEAILGPVLEEARRAGALGILPFALHASCFAAGCLAQVEAVRGQEDACRRHVADGRDLGRRGLLADEASFDDCFGRALRLHHATGMPWPTARTALAYGERLRRAGRRVDARVQLRPAAETFERMGARPWAERAAGELRATGETARRRDRLAADELTPQELQIALSVADGGTNREVGAALFLSSKRSSSTSAGCTASSGCGRAPSSPGCLPPPWMPCERTRDRLPSRREERDAARERS